MDRNATLPFDAWKARPSSATLISLLEASRPLVVTLCHQILRHPQDAEDASQLVFLQIVEDLPGIKDAGHFRHWIHRVCFHVALNLKRSRNRRREHERERAEHAQTAALPPADESTEAVHEHLARLDAETRALIVSHYFERRTLQDLAADHGCSTVTLGKKLEKAREELLLSLSRSGLMLAAPALESVLSSGPSVAAPIGPLSSVVLTKAGAGVTPWVPVAGGAAVKVKSMAAIVVIGLAGVGLLTFSALRPRPSVTTPEERSATLRAVPPGASSLAAAKPSEASSPKTASATRSEEAQDPEPPTTFPKTALLASIISLMHVQNEDGSWGDGKTALGDCVLGRTGVTSLALLSFLGAGYCHLSKDNYEGRDTGVTVRRALAYILKSQREDGSFITEGDPIVEQALTTLTLSEVYGMGASPYHKDPAQRATQALSRMQQADGSWGNSTATLWASEAFASARLSELTIDPEAMDRIKTYCRSQLDAGPNLPAMIGHIFLNRDATHPGLAQTAAWVSAVPPEPNRPDPMYCYMGSMALFQYDGPDGEHWKQWGESAMRALMRTHQNGFWQGRTQSQTVVQSSLATLTLEVYYRYANVFTVKRPGDR